MSSSYPDTWRIAVADDDEIVMTGLRGSQPAPALGESGRYEFHLVPDGREDHVARYERIVDYRDHAGEGYALGTSMGGQPWYSETHDDPSLFVALVPPKDRSTGRGLWGLIDGIDDSTEVPQRRCLVTVELVYLARLGDFLDESGAPDFGAARTVLEREGIGL